MWLIGVFWELYAFVAILVFACFYTCTSAVYITRDHYMQAKKLPICTVSPFSIFFFLFLWVMQIVKWWFCAEWLHAYLHECLPTCDCSPNTQVSSRDWSGKECMNEYELSKYIDFNFGLVNLVFRHANGRLSAGIQMRNRGYIGSSAYSG